MVDDPALQWLTPKKTWTHSHIMLISTFKHQIHLPLKTLRAGKSVAWSTPLPVSHNVFPIKHPLSASDIRCDCLLPLAQHFVKYWMWCGSQWVVTLYGFLSKFQHKKVPSQCSKNTQRLFSFVLLKGLSILSTVSVSTQLYSISLLFVTDCSAALLISEAMHSCYRELKPWMRST